jgi:hypothetical protein
VATLRPKIADDPERILILGGPKVGKTSAYLSIAAACPDVTMYVLDSDNAMRRMLSARPLPNVQVTPIDTWEDYVEGVRAVVAKAKPEDWLVIDFLSGAWDAVQAWYIEKRFGKTAEDYFTAHVAAAKKGNPLEGDTDWMAINKNHKAFMNMVKKAPCNVLATSTAKALGDRDDASLKSTYGLLGIRPEGQKHLSHDFHTLLVLSKTVRGEYQMTTAGDRERSVLEKAPLQDFAKDYLLRVAGWRPAA